MTEQNTGAFTIEQASWRDLLALSALEKECFDRDAWPLIEIMGVLAFPGVVRLRAVGDGKLVGFIAGDPRKRDNTGWILTLGVLPDWRRQGIAGALLGRVRGAAAYAADEIVSAARQIPPRSAYMKTGL